MSWCFTVGDQSIGASVSASVLPMNFQGWFLSELTGWISLQFKGLSRVFSNTIVWKHPFFSAQTFLWSNSHIHTWLLKKKKKNNKVFNIRTFVSKIMSLFLNTLSKFVIAFLPKSKCLNFVAAVTICSDFGDQKSKVCHYFHCFSNYLPWNDGTGCHDLLFLNVEF